MNSTYQRIEQLCKQNDTNVTKMCRDLRIPRTSLSELKEERIKSISADKMEKIALFGGDVDVTDEMWKEVEDFANYIVAKHKKISNK